MRPSGGPGKEDFMAETVLLVGDSYSDTNIFYASRFLASDPFIYLIRNGRGTLVTSSMEQGRAQKESAAADVCTYDDYGYRELLAQTGNRDAAFTGMLTRVVDGENTLTVESTFPVLYADALRDAGLTLQVDPSLFRQERRQKSPEELEAIAEAQRAAGKAFQNAVDLLRASEEHGGILTYMGIPLTSERLRAEIETGLTRDGMDTSHTPIVAGGPGAADPHWLGSGPFRSGESIVMDIFPRGRRNRYFGDLTRTVVRGTPNDPLRAMYDSVMRAFDAALSQVRAGANGRDVHAAAERVFAADGFAGEGRGPRLIHSLGHGVGLDIHEAPSLGSVDMELLPGDVVTIEPGLYDPSVGAIRVEDTVVVTDDGYRQLADIPKFFEI